MSRILIENDNGSIEDLGMRGEYPWSSSVGRKFTLNDKTVERWYDTEINPSGETLLEYHTNTMKDVLNGVPNSDSTYVLERLKLN
jgi:hypothetical protein